MKTIEIFDPAMCCPTGLCGPNINPELFRIAVVLETLNLFTKHRRFNLRRHIVCQMKKVIKVLDKKWMFLLSKPKRFKDYVF